MIFVALAFGVFMFWGFHKIEKSDPEPKPGERKGNFVYVEGVGFMYKPLKKPPISGERPARSTPADTTEPSHPP